MPQADQQAIAKMTEEDRLDILQIISQFNFFEDSGDAEGWGYLFTVDGVFEPPGRRIAGRDNLIAYARQKWVERPNSRLRTHWAGNVTIAPTAEGATAFSYHLTVDKTADGYIVHDSAAKSDELRREDGVWRFHIRRIVPVSGG